MDVTSFFVNLFTPTGFISVLQFLVLVLEVLYLIFAFILIRQVKLMNKSFSTSLARAFDLVALVHFGAAALLIFVSMA